MLKAQPRFSGNGGHGKRLLETEEEVFEKSLLDTGRKLASSFGQSFKRGSQGIPKPKIASRTQANYRAGQAGSYLGMNKKPLAIGAAGGGAAVGGYSLLNKRGTFVHGAGTIPGRSKLLGAAREVEQASFKAVKPKPLVKQPKVYNVGKREPQVWEVRNGKSRSTTLDKTKKARQGDLVGMRLHRDQQGKRSATAAAGLFGAGVAGTAGSFLAKTPRGRIGSGLAGAGASIGSIAASRNARHHTAVEVKNLSQGTHYVVGGRKYKIDDAALERGKLNVNAPKSKVRKRERTYDSEMNRHRRQGMYVAGTALGGGALVAGGGRELSRDMTAGRRLQSELGDLRRSDVRVSRAQPFLGQSKKAKRPFKLPVGEPKKQNWGTHYTEGSRPLTHAQRQAIERLPNLGQRTSRATKGKLAAGGAMLAGSGALYRHSRSPQNRKRWN